MEKKTVLIALSLAMFILVIDTTIMNVSFSTLISEFNTNVATIQSIITLYTLAFAGEVIIIIIVLLASRSILDAPFETEEKSRLDIAGATLSTLGIGLFVFGILLAGKYGWWKARHTFEVGGIEFSPFGLSPTPVFVVSGILVLLIFALW